MKMKRLIAALAVLALLCTGTALGERKTKLFEEEWYLQALKDSVISLGNNARLKNVIARAQNGEEITLATIGGSITAGMGAPSYQTCWASRFASRFSKAYGVNNGANVHLVNAGVSGTPSTFGLMRYQRDIVDRVPETDPDGLPDVVIVEYAVNDRGDPTRHRCYESLVKGILDAPNEPAVILLFSVFRNGFNLQEELKKVGYTYGLMMVSVKTGIYGHIGKELTADGFFYDQEHPTSLGHRIMADCVMQAIGDTVKADADTPQAVNRFPVFGTDFIGLKTIYGDTETTEFTVERGGFRGSDDDSYRNKPVGQVCGNNFFHDAKDPMEPLKVTGVFRKCMIAWKATNDEAFGAAEILVDGKVIRKAKGNKSSWGQSRTDLILDDKYPQEHTLEIRVTEEGKKFTITAIALQ